MEPSEFTINLTKVLPCEPLSREIFGYLILSLKNFINSAVPPGNSVNDIEDLLFDEECIGFLNILSAAT